MDVYEAHLVHKNDHGLVYKHLDVYIYPSLCHDTRYFQNGHVHEIHNHYYPGYFHDNLYRDCETLNIFDHALNGVLMACFRYCLYVVYYLNPIPVRNDGKLEDLLVVHYYSIQDILDYILLLVDSFEVDRKQVLVDYILLMSLIY